MKFNLDEKNIKLILKFEKFSFFISIIGIIVLYIHLIFYIDNILFEIGTGIFKCGLIAGVSSFCSGLFISGVQRGFLK